VVVGAGPVGLVLAGLLGRAGRRVTVVERRAEPYALARAGHVDHEIMRILQSLGAAVAVEQDAHLADRYVFQNADGEVLMSFDYGAPGISGWRSDYIFYQPVLEAALRRTLAGLPAVEIRSGWEATDLVQDTDAVQLAIQPVLQDAAGARRLGSCSERLRARYLVGADGAGSYIRNRLDIPWDDLGFASSWLVVDLTPIGDEPLRFPYDNTQVCDPRRPHCLFQLGRHHRRFEFAVLPDEDPTRLEQASVAWELMAPYGVTPSNAAIERRAVYRFGSAVARHFRDGRAFLAGDAAHLMPPFMGQGMCTGIRDAANLAWRIDLALREPRLADILDDYEPERFDQSTEIVRMSIAAGEVSCTFDPAVAAERDRLFREGGMPAPQSIPGLRTGLLTDSPLAGALSPQGRVRLVGSVGRFDDVAGRGWVLVTTDPDMVPATPALDRLGEALGLRVVVVDDVADVEGTYRRWFAGAGCTAFVARPDFYLYGTGRSADEMATILDDLEADIQRRKL